MKRLFFIFLAFLLFACSFMSQAQDSSSGTKAVPLAASPENSAGENEAAQSDEGETEEGKSNGALPTAELTSDLLYEILAADIALQRRDYRLAFDGMMDLARRTGDPRLAKRATEVAVKERNAMGALDSIRLWHKLAPDSAEAEKYLIGFLIIENRLDELQAVLAERLAQATPAERGPLMFQYQQFLSSSKEKVKAFRVMETVVSSYPDMPESHVALSLLAFANKDRERAQKEAREALRLKPDSELAVLTLAQAETDPIKSIETLSGFLEKYPAAHEVRIAKARMLITQRNYDQAKIEFEKLLEGQPDDLMILYSLGLLAIQNNDYAGAEKYLKHYLDVAEKSSRPLAESYQAVFLLAQMAEEQKQYDVALAWMDRISQSVDSEAWIMAQIKKAQIMAMQGKISDARKNLSMLRQEQPLQEDRLILAEAQILRSHDMQKEAYVLLKTAVVKSPTNINLLYDFALAAEREGGYDEMEKSLRRIIEIDPNHQYAYNALGYSFADRNIHIEEAYSLIAKALSLAPDDPYITDSMGWVLFRQGKLKEAELMLRRAYELLPETEVMVHLGEVLWLSGQQEEATKLFYEVKKQEPENKVLLDTMKRLDIRLNR